MAEPVSKRAKRTVPPKDLPAIEGLVAFRVDGERFEILEQTIRAKGDTLLATLLDDPQRGHVFEIYVEGNKQRFRYILDWYRYGSILLPQSISLAEMKRDCAFFQLPDDVNIQHEQPRLVETEGMLEKRLKEILSSIETKRQDAKNKRKVAQTEIAGAHVVHDLVSSFRKQRDFSYNAEVEPFEGTQLNEVVQSANGMLKEHGYAVDGLSIGMKGKGKGKLKGKGKEPNWWQFRLSRNHLISDDDSDDSDSYDSGSDWLESMSP